MFGGRKWDLDGMPNTPSPVEGLSPAYLRESPLNSSKYGKNMKTKGLAASMVNL